MRPNWPKLACLTQRICTLWFQFFGAFFASKGYPFKNIFDTIKHLFNDVPINNVFLSLKEINLFNTLQLHFYGMFIFLAFLSAY